MLSEGSSSLAPGARIVIVGGGFTGALAAMHLALARPDLSISIVERERRVGRGLAYGACADRDLLNVPVSRLHIGSPPAFEDWLVQSGALAEPEVEKAIAEAGGSLADAFVPRRLFGDFIAMRLEAMRNAAPQGAIRIARATAVGFLDPPRRGVQLDDGRRIEADVVILALGNLPPRPPAPEASILHDHPAFINDPWPPGALDHVPPDARVVLVGSGLTMADIAFRLDDRGHRGPMIALSRHGLSPRPHAFGGAWAPFLTTRTSASPLELLAIIRAEVAKADRQGVPWQRVIDAVRPSIGRIWQSWDASSRRAFLRHLRAYWDVHRHRLAPRAAARLDSLMASGRLALHRVKRLAFDANGAGLTARAVVDGEPRRFAADAVISCIGPRTDYDRIGDPLIADGRRRGVICADALGLGVETDNCAMLEESGRRSHWLFALGPLTRPAWWEITAVPEIVAQVSQLGVLMENRLSDDSLADAFQDLGAGI